ncbi:Uncharacterised protein [Mycobacterium tuberculosis]|uniref:Uncharacterized protein n=1 Tax=Mycobacterium tuberculosis TaxID=1773 RepID=A0A655AJJ9_MYCTX|nr:Uncharacterised protein [Mycobacterium tuberculosis]
MLGWHDEDPIHDGLPTRTARPDTVPLTPRPGMARKSVTASRRVVAAAIASATECSDAASTVAAKASTWSASQPGAAVTALTCSRPVVRVPVLSKTTVSTARVASNDL